jgi:peptidoglycan pentaglycine glycine transferase (the first glycine)
MVSVAEIDEARRGLWDFEIAKFENAHPLNAYGWGKVRAIDGWSPTYLIANRGSSVVGAVMLLTKPIGLTGFSVMYAPRGPLFDLRDIETLKALLYRVRIQAKRSHSIFLRIDPNIPEVELLKADDPFIPEGFVHLIHRWTFWSAPRDVYRIDLTKFASEGDIFRSLHSKARTSIRKAHKQGLIIASATEERDLAKFYSIFRRHTVEKGFMSRGYEYQKALWDEFIIKGNGRLFLALHNGEIVGGAIRLLFGRKCLSMHIAVPYSSHHLRANDALVWESIRWAKENGCKWFSFRGVGATPTQEQFKRKFGPEVVSLVGYYDLPFHPVLYRLFSFAEFEILPRVWSTLMRARRMTESARS